MDRGLKCPPRHQFSIHNDGFSISSIFMKIFDFFSKNPQFLRFSYKTIHLTPIWNLTKFVRNFDFGSKTILQPFRMTEGDHFSYRDHNFWTKIRSCENRFSTTMDFCVFYWFYKQFLYWPLQSPLWGPFSPKSIQKSFFSDLDFFGWGCSRFEPTLPKGQVRPKRHPKSLVCASERYSRKYPNVSKYPRFVWNPNENQNIFLKKSMRISTRNQRNLKIFCLHKSLVIVVKNLQILKKKCVFFVG